MVRKCGPVQSLVAFPTKCYEVLLRVVTEGAAPSHVVDIEIPEDPHF